MDQRLFEDLVASAPRMPRPRGRFAWPVSVTAHALLAAAAASAPGLTSIELPAPAGPARRPVVLEAPPPPTASRGSAVRPQGPAGRAASRTATPAATPVVDSPGPATADERPTDDVAPRGLIDCGGFIAESSSAPEAPEPGRGYGTGSDSPRRAGIEVAAPRKIRDVAPEYPELARRAGVEGVVVIDCTIEPLGLVSGVQVLSGHPLLNQAALDAVRQWRYEPTRINGVPVPVVLTVTVRFNLRRP